MISDSGSEGSFVSHPILMTYSVREYIVSNNDIPTRNVCPRCHKMQILASILSAFLSASGEDQKRSETGSDWDLSLSVFL